MRRAWIESNGKGRTFMGLESQCLQARCCIPKLDSPVLARGGKACSVWAETQVEYYIAVPSIDSVHRPGCCVPEDDFPVGAHRGEVFAVRAVCHPIYRALVALKRQNGTWAG